MLRGVLWRLCTRLSVGSLTAKLDGSPLADHRAVRVGGHAGVLSFVLVPDGVADDEVAAHQAVMVRLFVQVHFDVVFQPTAGEKTRVKGGKFLATTRLPRLSMQKRVLDCFSSGGPQ